MAFGIVLPAARQVEILEFGASGLVGTATATFNSFYVTSGSVDDTSATRTAIPNCTFTQAAAGQSSVILPNERVVSYDLANVVTSGYTGVGVVLQLEYVPGGGSFTGVLWMRYRPIEFPSTY